MDFEKKVAHVLVETVNHSLQSLDFVIDPFGNSRCNPQDKVQDAILQEHNGREAGNTEKKKGFDGKNGVKLCDALQKAPG